MLQIKVSEGTANLRRVPVLLVDATDGYTPETGITSAVVKISKNGAAQVTGSGTFAAIGNGQYYYQCTAGEIDTLGWVYINVSATGCRDWNISAQVVNFSPTQPVVQSYVPVTTPLGTGVRQTIVYFQGATLPLREDILQQQDRTPLDLTGATIIYELTKADATTPTVYASGTVLDAAAGRVRYTWQSGDLDVEGTYRERWIVNYPTGSTSIFGPLVKVQ